MGPICHKQWLFTKLACLLSYFWGLKYCEGPSQSPPNQQLPFFYMGRGNLHQKQLRKGLYTIASIRLCQGVLVVSESWQDNQ